MLATLAKLMAGVVAAGGAGLAIAGENKRTELFFTASTAATPLVRLFDPETAHRIAVLSAAYRLTPRETRPDPPSLAVTLWGRRFPNPLGMAAGFDKDAEAMPGILGMGFGHVEIGSVTPRPQPGNPKPRVFRIVEKRAVINRYGFNSVGVDEVRNRLEAWHEAGREGGIVGVNIGKNKTSEDAARDFVEGAQKLAPFADYLVINVSSPNTPGLRALQTKKELEKLVTEVQAARKASPWKLGSSGQAPPLVVKVDPDLTDDQIKDIAEVALKTKVDGLIVSNTTLSRPESIKGLPNADEAGGLSGEPLMEKSTEALRKFYKLTKGKIPLIGCGGVSSGKDAYKKIRAGATLVQLYTGMVYQGAGLVPDAKAELAELLASDGFNSVSEAIGADYR